MKTNFVILFTFFSIYCFSQTTFILQKKKNTKREVEVKLPLITVLRLKDGKTLTGYVFAIKDSTLRIACFRKPAKAKRDSLNKILRKGNLPLDERMKISNKVYYPDTTEILFSKTKSLRVPSIARKHGAIRSVALGFAFASGVYLSWGLMQNNLANDNNVRKVSPIILYGDMAALTAGFWFTANKSFKPEKWKLK